MKKIWQGKSRRKKRTLRDYHRKRYENPMFPRNGGRDARERGIFTKIPVGWLVLTFGVPLFAWYAIWSPALRVTTIDIRGASPATEARLRAIIEERLKSRVAGVLPSSNLFFLRSSAVKEDIGKGFAFSSLDVRKKLPHTLTVDVSEKSARAAYVAEGRFYAVDEGGTVIRELTEQEISGMHDLPSGVGSTQVLGLGAQAVVLGSAPPAPEKERVRSNQNALPLITSPEGMKAPKPGTPAVPTGALSLMFQAYARLPDVVGTGVRWFSVPDGSDTVDATIEGDWHVLMSSALPFDVQGDRLSVVLKDKIGDKRQSLDYVDLRYNERIFFKFKGGQ